MAEIDKPLPNVDIKDEAFVETEVETPIEENLKNEDVEVTMDEEGGAEISFDPAADQLQSTDHFQNLAEIMDDQDLDELGTSLFDKYTDYKESRGDWEQSYSCLLYTSPSPRDGLLSRMPSSA